MVLCSFRKCACGCKPGWSQSLLRLRVRTHASLGHRSVCSVPSVSGHVDQISTWILLWLRFLDNGDGEITPTEFIASGAQNCFLFACEFCRAGQPNQSIPKYWLERQEMPIAMEQITWYCICEQHQCRFHAQFDLQFLVVAAPCQEGASRLRGSAKAVDIWRLETKVEATGARSNDLHVMMCMYLHYDNDCQWIAKNAGVVQSWWLF